MGQPLKFGRCSQDYIRDLRRAPYGAHPMIQKALGQAKKTVQRPDRVVGTALLMAARFVTQTVAMHERISGRSVLAAAVKR